VVFSSDLVFDGRVRSAYTEDVLPNPLNVYGATKADADRLVSLEWPGALVIRTSAFFGPWDEHNFAAQLTRALQQGACFRAPADTIVSPTYVPHLVQAVLDLLLDEAQGLWHVANAGEVSWFDFARTLAERMELPAEFVAPIEAAALWGPATRPRYSALASKYGQLLPPLDHAIDEYVRDVEWAARRTEQCVSR
jgi:dTDP-4-dehydrorhamnose reductase